MLPVSPLPSIRPQSTPPVLTRLGLLSYADAAAMAAHSPLRRWRRFYSTFDAIDAAVEASDPADHPGDELQCARVLRGVKGEIVEFLCDAPEDDAAEELCRVLDDVMVESLITLQSVPVTTSALASTDLAKDVGALEEHESERIRCLARDIVRGWRASVEGELARAKTTMEELDRLSDEQQAPESPAPVVGHARNCHVPVAADEEDETKRRVKEAPRPKTTSHRLEPAKSDALRAKVSVPLSKRMRIPVVGAGRASTASMEEMLPKKMQAVVGNGGGDRVWSDTMEANKRKLREGYQELEDAKRRRKIQVIEAPKMVEQRQRKMHPITRERSQARYASSTAMRRSLMSSFVS